MLYTGALSSKPIDLKKLKILEVLFLLKASSSVVGFLRRSREDANLGQFMVMCSIVRGMLHKSHIGLRP